MALKKGMYDMYFDVCSFESLHTFYGAFDTIMSIKWK